MQNGRSFRFFNASIGEVGGRVIATGTKGCIELNELEASYINAGGGTGKGGQRKSADNDAAFIERESVFDSFINYQKLSSD